MRSLVVGAFVLVAIAARFADAYPQFQLERDATCSGCHLSPAGGGLLNENGLAAAEAMSQWGTAPEFMYNAIPTPSWLELGGDFRGAGGYTGGGPTHSVSVFPMQADLYVAATYKGFSLHVTGGLRDPQYNNENATLFSTREHWLQWQQKPGEPNGLFIRVGRFMPVYGLRQVEHVDYDRQYGGSPLYDEAYGVAIEYIDPRWEVHATGFHHDPFFPASIERGNGAALYTEARLTKSTALGLEGKLDITTDDTRWYGGIIAKQWLSAPKIMLEAELEAVHQKVDAGGTNKQLVGYLLASYYIGAFMIDLGIGAYEPNVTVRYLDREAADLNIHWFTTSHLELILTNRLQMLELGEGGEASGYSMLQIHYRL